MKQNPNLRSARRFFFFFTKLSYLKSRDPFFLRGLDLSNDVIVQPKDCDRDPSAPFVPQRRHPALNGDRARPPRVLREGPRRRVDNPSGMTIEIVDGGGRRLHGEASRIVEHESRHGEEAGYEASGGGGHGGRGSTAKISQEAAAERVGEGGLGFKGGFN